MKEESATVFSYIDQYDLRQTKVYRKALEEGKLEAKLASIPRLLALGLNLKQIAQALELEIEQVRQATQSTQGE